MPLVTKSNTFTNGTTADASQVNQDFDTLYNLVNGLLDSANIAPNGVQTSNVGGEVITPAKTKGIAYAIDLLGTSGFVFSGLTVTKDGTNANKIDIASGIAYLYQTDGTLRRMAIGTASYTTTSASATFYLDLNPDGTFSWGGSHSTQSNYITIATVTSDASSNVNVITDTRSTLINLFAGTAGVVNLPGQSKSNGNALLQSLSGGYKVQGGQTSVSATGSAWSTIGVTFPTAFSTTPQVVKLGVVGTEIRVYLSAISVSSTGFTIAVYNSDATTTISIGWEATGS